MKFKPDIMKFKRYIESIGFIHKAGNFYEIPGYGMFTDGFHYCLLKRNPRINFEYRIMHPMDDLEPLRKFIRQHKLRKILE